MLPPSDECLSFEVELSALRADPRTAANTSLVMLPRQQGGHYFLSFRSREPAFPMSLDSMVSVHYQLRPRSNTELSAFVRPGEEWRDPTTPWRLRVGNISCPYREAIVVAIDYCPHTWPVLAELSCGGSGNRGYRGDVNVTSCGEECVNWSAGDFNISLDSAEGNYSNPTAGLSGAGLGNHSQCRNPDGKAA